MPALSGLKISNSPQIFRSASFINGRPSVRLEMSFQVRPTREGSFTLPSWDITVGGMNLTVPAANLRVLPTSQQDLIRREKEKKKRGTGSKRGRLHRVRHLETLSFRRRDRSGYRATVSLERFARHPNRTGSGQRRR